MRVPPPGREMRRLPGLRLGPPSPPLQARGPSRSAGAPPAGAASGELSPGAAGTRGWGRGGGGPWAAAPPAMGRGEAGGANGAGGSRPGAGGCRQSRSLPHPRSAPPGFKAPRAAGGGAASAERREEMRQGAAPPAPCAPRPRWPWSRSACWRCPPLPPPPTSGQCPPRPRPASPARLPPLLGLEQGQHFPSAGPGRGGTSNSDLSPRRTPVPARCRSSRPELGLCLPQLRPRSAVPLGPLRRRPSHPALSETSSRPLRPA